VPDVEHVSQTIGIQQSELVFFMINLAAER